MKKRLMLSGSIISFFIILGILLIAYLTKSFDDAIIDLDEWEI